MAIKVLMYPQLESFSDRDVSGIHTIVRAWYKHAPAFGIQYVKKDAEDYDVFAVHAGMSDRKSPSIPMTSHLHGVYWTADYATDKWELDANAHIIQGLRSADEITVPSEWVADVIRRDMRVNPAVIPHGIDWQDWQHSEKCQGYVLAYGKNRVGDVCDPSFLPELARKFPRLLFVATFAPPNCPPNVQVIGTVSHNKMKLLIQRAAVVMSPIKETFGVLTLEAMASGKPVLGFAHGGNLDLVTHGVNGYLATPNGQDDLAFGLDYCLKHAKTLGDNGQEMAKQWTWPAAMERLVAVYQRALQDGKEPPNVAVVIPSYNYSHKVGRAIESVQKQEYQASEIVVVDDGSPDDGATEDIVLDYAESDKRIRYIRQNNSGVAVARNNGIAHASSKYILCLDADDQIDPLFLKACVPELEADPSLGIAYTRLQMLKPDDSSGGVSEWPGPFEYDKALERKNQVPTACVFRRKMWERLGGYRQRYAPHGAGSEDANFWLRAGAYGFNAKLVTDAPLFIYSVGEGHVSGNKNYHEVDWLGLHPWVIDKKHPFASVATPTNGRSHLVRQYDEPIISVIIPVGPHHKDTVFNALDSLEAQSFRKWEAILVDDSGDLDPYVFDGYPDGLKAYPYVRYITTPGKRGAGYARNRGAEAARAPFLLFLDADDNLLTGNALESMLYVWEMSQSIIYTDYIGKAYIDPQEALKLQRTGRLLEYDEKTQLAMVRHNSTEFECERAIIQPSPPEYIWCLVTALLPKSWHFEIGGFDEKMPSWEDWDYWIRMARMGKCFTRISEPLVAYRFYSGTRREMGGEIFKDLIQYLLKKYKGDTPMACKGCGNKSVPPVTKVYQAHSAPAKETTMSDSDLVMATLVDGNRGQHKIVGMITGTVYGYRADGDRFYVHKKDLEASPGVFRLYVESVPTPPANPPPPPPVRIISPEPVVQFQKMTVTESTTGAAVIEETVAIPAKLDWAADPRPFDIGSVPGVTAEIAQQLTALGITTLQGLVDFGTEGLKALDGVSGSRAGAIIRKATQMLEPKDGK